MTTLFSSLYEKTILFLENYFPNQHFPNVQADTILDSTLETLAMLGISLFFTVLFGLILGIILYLTSPKQLLANRYFYPVASLATNILRSIPFIILIVVLFPLTQTVMGTKFGVKGAIFPLIVGAAPFFAKLVETSLREVDKGVIEAAQSMGTPMRKIITRVLLPEARPSIIAGITITGILLLSFTAMAGTVGGGGLGNTAVQAALYRRQPDLANLTLIIVIVVAQIIQFTGDRLMHHFIRK